MATNIRRFSTLNRPPVRFWQSGDTSTLDRTTPPILISYVSSDNARSSRMSEGSKIFNDDPLAFPKETRYTKLRLTALLVPLTLLIMAIIGTAIVLPLVLVQNSLTTVTPTTVTPSVTTATTTISNCVTPYVRAPSGSCVNTLLDFNNCGSIGTICSNPATSCSAGVCSTVPVVQLSNATSIWTGGVDGSADDNILNVTLPFSITLYTTTTSYVQVTTNGVLCLGQCSNAWTETALPASSYFGAAVLPYWDDLFIYAKTWQGIYYASQGSAPNRQFTLEYYMSHYAFPNQYYQFQVIFFEATPGIVQIIYFSASDGGVSCTVGVQGSNSSQFTQYSFDQANSVQPNMVLTFYPNLGTYTYLTSG